MRAAWSPRKIAVALTIFGFCVRLGLAMALGLNAPPPVGSDQQEYDSYAWNLAQGRGYRGPSPDVADTDHLTAYRVPGTSLSWAGLYAIFGHRYDVVRILHCVAGAATVLLTFEIGLRCYGARVGLLAAAATAVFPTALIYTVDLLSDALGMFSFLGFILATLRFADQPGWGRAAASGLLLGTSILYRPNSVFMLPLVIVWAVWQFRGEWRLLLRSAAIPALVVIVLAPWAVRNYMTFHEFIPLATSGGSGLLQGNNDVVVSDPKYFGYSVWDTGIPEYRAALQSAGNEFERDRRAKVFAIQWLRSHPEKWLFLVRHKLWRSVTPILNAQSPWYFRAGMLVAWGPVFVISALAFVPTLIQFLRARHSGWLIHLGILHYLMTSVIFYALARYRIAVEPLCLILSAQALVFVVERWNLTKNSSQCTGNIAAVAAGRATCAESSLAPEPGLQRTSRVDFESKSLYSPDGD